MLARKSRRVTAVEYGLMAALVAFGAIGSLSATGLFASIDVYLRTTR